MMDKNRLYIIVGAIVLIVVLWYVFYYSKKNVIKPLIVKLPQRFSNEVVNVEPAGVGLPPEENKDSIYKYKVSRIVYNSLPWGEYKNNNTLAVKSTISTSRVSKDKSLDIGRAQEKQYLYDYSPTSFAQITPVFWLLENNKWKDYTYSVTSPNTDYVQKYNANPDIYNKIVFYNFFDVLSSIQETSQGLKKNMVPTSVDSINSIYLMFARAMNTAGKYKIKYGKMKYNLDTKRWDNTYVINNPVEFELQPGQDEMLLEFDPVKLSNDSGTVDSIFFIDIRKELTATNTNPTISISEILFNFKNNFEEAKTQLLIREKQTEYNNAISLWRKREEQLTADEKMLRDSFKLMN